MRHVVTVFTVFMFFFLTLGAFAQDEFGRVSVIPADSLDPGGFGGIVAGVDFDGDGNSEIYAVNNDWVDIIGADLVPRLYKYERDTNGDWTVVWWTRLPFDFQNTWPAFEYADLDNDGRKEIVWGPVNNFGAGTNPNPPRIVVYESAGDGSDVMGVDNGDGTFRPNAEWNLDLADETNVRPFRWLMHDIDGDGTTEIVTALRAGDNRAQIYSVDNIPDNGDSSEVWTMEFNGLGSSTNYDLAILNGTAYFISSGGNVTGVTWDATADTFAIGPTQDGLVPGGSWKSASVVDFGDGSGDVIVVASWAPGDADPDNKAIRLLQQDADTLLATVIADFDDTIPNNRRLNGGDAGDIDGDGNWDFVFGVRNFDTPVGPPAAVVRLEYLGGDITDPASFQQSILDSSIIGENGAQVDVIEVMDVDFDGVDEVVYAGVTRPFGSGPPTLPITILKSGVAVSVPSDRDLAPRRFVLHQNYPNPFNPATQISYDLFQDAAVLLKIYNLRGQEVRTLVDETKPAGTYTVRWDGSSNAGTRVASGVYIYVLRAGEFVQSRRMTFIK